MSLFRGYFVLVGFDFSGMCQNKCTVKSFSVKQTGCGDVRYPDPQTGKPDLLFDMGIEVDAEFDDGEGFGTAQTRPSCHCCSYRQYACCDMLVEYVQNGKVVRSVIVDECEWDKEHMGPKPILPEEDDDEGRFYGHRDDPPEKDHDEYKPNQKTGCTYIGRDRPGITRLAMLDKIPQAIQIRFTMRCYMSFRIIDTCNDGLLVEKEDSYAVICGATWQGML